MPVRIVQVGLGRWGLNWAHTIVTRVAGIEAVGWVEADTKSLARAQAILNVPANRCFTSLSAALHDIDTDAVLITANVDAHAPLAEIAIAAGKHVLVEKPFTSTVDQARHLVDLADERGFVLMVSQNFRFFPAAAVAARLVREQVLGPVHSVNIDFRRFADYGPNDEGRIHYALRQPLLEELSIHHFDLMRMVLGQEPRQIYCCAWNPSGSKFREAPVGTATINFDGGAVVNYRGSWISAGKETAYGGEWHMECAEGEIAWTCRGDRDVSLNGERVMICRLQQAPAPVELLSTQYFGRTGALAAFAHTIENGSEPPFLSSGRNNIGSLVLMHAAIESAVTGKVVSLVAE